MPLKNYHLVVGKPIEWALDDDDSPHIEVLLDVAGEKFRAAINVRSKIPPHTLVFKNVEPFNHTLIETLNALSEGVYDLKRQQHVNLTLDYVRNGMVQREMMEELPYSISGHSMLLKNKNGGKIRLISPDDFLLQEVVYQKKDVRREGWSLVF